jgi:fibronectin-binding autotransporter adhesin
MAAYFWVGGSGTWNTTTTTNWSLSSGGAGGAGVPTAADTVTVNAFSGSPTITLAGGVCLDLNTTGATCVITASGTLTISGSLTLSATTTWTIGQTGQITFNATTTGKTVTCNANTIYASFNFNGVGGGWTLGSALTFSLPIGNQNRITLTAGSLNTNNQTIICDTFSATGTGVRSLTLGTSTINTTGSATNNFVWDISVSTNMTFNGASSTLIITQTGSAGTGFAGGGLTYGSVTINGLNTNTSNSLGITGANTFSSLTFTNGAATTRSFYIGANQIVTGTFTASNTGTAGINRIGIYSDVLGTARTITAAAVSLLDVDFRDITGAGTAVWSGTRIGNCGRNTNITTTAAKTVYWNNTVNSTAWNSATAWAATSGAAAASTNYPLPQDTAVFSNTGTTTGNAVGVPTAINTAYYQYSPANIIATGMTNTLTFTNFIIHDTVFTNSSTITLSTPTLKPWSNYVLNGTGQPNYSGATLTIDQAVASTGVISLGAAWSSASLAFTITQGNFSLNNFNFTNTTAGVFSFNGGSLTLGSGTLSVFAFSTSTATNRVINFNTGQINLSGSGNAWNSSTITGFSYTGTSKINLTSGASNTMTMGPATAAQALNVNALSCSGLNKSGAFNNLDYTGLTGLSSGTITIYGNLNLGSTFTAETTIYTFAATSGTQTITSNGKQLSGTVTINGAGGTVSLVDNLIMTVVVCTLTAGTLSLNNNTLGVAAFISSGSNTRAINFGTGQINLSNSGTAWDSSTSTNFSYTGTSKINLNYGGGGLVTLNTDSSSSQTQSLNFNITAGFHTLTKSGAFNNLNYTGFIGTALGTITIYGNLTLASLMTAAANYTFAATSGTQTITSNGKQLSGTVTINGAGGTVSLLDNLTTSAGVTLTGGTLAIGNNTLTVGTFASNNANTRAITFGSGTMLVSGASWDAGTSINLSVTPGTGTISMTSATAKTFSGGGYTNFPKLNNGGAGALTISGNNTFASITNSVQPTTFTFTSGSTQTVKAWNVNGTTGNLVTLNTVTAGTRASLTYSGTGTLTSDYLSIQDIKVTPISKWYATNSIFVSNNIGWNGEFAANFLSFF